MYASGTDEHYERKSFCVQGIVEMDLRQTWHEVGKYEYAKENFGYSRNYIKRGVHVSWVSMLGFIESCHYHYIAVVPFKYGISVSLNLRGY